MMKLRGLCKIEGLNVFLHVHLFIRLCDFNSSGDLNTLNEIGNQLDDVGVKKKNQNISARQGGGGEQREGFLVTGISCSTEDPSSVPRALVSQLPTSL